jgi:hypothetical protein
MSYKLGIKREKDFLYACIKGNRTSESIKNVTREICEKCIKNQCTKVLVDVRDFKDHISTKDSFSLASIELPEIIRESITKVAILDMGGFENGQIFFENVARYWGHNVRIFTDIIDAKQWIS